jgi:hypothetical protein
MSKRKKTLYELQYENAQVENTVNKGVSCVLMGFILFWPALILFILVFGK